MLRSILVSIVGVEYHEVHDDGGGGSSSVV